MILPDVNVLIYAHRAESPDHARYAAWLTGLVTSDQPFAVSELAASAVIRIATNPKAFQPASTLQEAFAFVDSMLEQPNCRRLRPGPDHWTIFQRLAGGAQARGKLVADAYHAALAMEYGCEFVTADSDFARFAGLRWRHPLAAQK
ncbi:MAG TPA: type II toxin-antitoxin system VapC family toxin [Polyangiaceae bacterium]|nr:type II toxin-antitoxin system VapC family toxin [Polyangiaceae bacterium]